MFLLDLLNWVPAFLQYIVRAYPPRGGIIENIHAGERICGIAGNGLLPVGLSLLYCNRVAFVLGPIGLGLRAEMINCRLIWAG